MASSFAPQLKPATSAFAQTPAGSFKPQVATAPAAGTPEWKAAQTIPGYTPTAYAQGQTAANQAGGAASADFNKAAGWVLDPTTGQYKATGFPQTWGQNPAIKKANDDKAADEARQGAADAAGLDFMKPGAQEAFNAQYGTKPLEQSGYASWLEQNRMDPNAKTTQQTYADKVLGQSHGVGDADFDKYYDRSEQNATQKLNDQLSARGTYGTSVGLGQIGSMLADMEGNRARDKASYGLERSADDRSWASTQGDLAAGADSSGIDRWSTAGQAELAASNESLSRWKAAESSAEGAQAAQRNRGQDLFNNNMAIGGALSGAAGSSYDSALAQDQGLVDAVVSLGLGKDAESVAQIIQRANQGDAQAKQILDLAMTMKAIGQPAAAKP